MKVFFQVVVVAFCFGWIVMAPSKILATDADAWCKDQYDSNAYCPEGNKLTGHISYKCTRFGCTQSGPGDFPVNYTCTNMGGKCLTKASGSGYGKCKAPTYEYSCKMTGSCSNCDTCQRGYCCNRVKVCGSTGAANKSCCVNPPGPFKPATPSCTLAITGPELGATGEMNKYTATATPKDGTISNIEFGGSGYTPIPYSQDNTVSSSIEITPVSFPVTISATATVLDTDGKNPETCTQSLTLNAPTVVFKACKSIDSFTCDFCDPPTNFDGTVTVTNKLDQSINSGNNYQTSYAAVEGGVATLTSNSPTMVVISPSVTIDYTDEAQFMSVDGVTYTHDFCVTERVDPWFQVWDGDIGVMGNLSTITPLNDFLLYETVPDTNTSGVALAAGSISVTGGIIGPPNRNWSAPFSSYYTPPTEGFAYFARLTELGTPTSNLDEDMDWSTAPLKTTVNPITMVTEDTHYREGDLHVSDIDVNDGVSRVIFVHGNLIVDGNVIVDSASDSFLAFIVSGDITFTGNVSQAQGVYIADGHIVVENADTTIAGVDFRQFVGEGIFVGWDGVTMNRDLISDDSDDNDKNNLYPATLFVYRPDFVTNAPSSLKRSGIAWKEIAPTGTP